MKKFSFCHGWLVDPHGFSEITCKKRNNCAYYCVDFYKRFDGRLDEFEEMFPMSPCSFFIAKSAEESPVEKSEEAFSLFVGIK